MTKKTRVDAWGEDLPEKVRWDIYDTARTMPWPQAVCDQLEALGVKRLPTRAAWYRFLSRMRQADAERRMANLTRAVAQGMDYADAAPEIERCKVEYAAAAASRAMDEQAGSFDVGDFADFLQFGATLDHDAVLASFVHQVLVLDGEVVVTLLVDNEKGDPLRLSFPAVRPNVVWLPWQHSTRNMRIAVSGGAVLIAFAA